MPFIDMTDKAKMGEFAFNESLFALRRQDKILMAINEFGVDVSLFKFDSMRPYLALLERFYMELSVIYANEWEEVRIKNEDTGQERITIQRPEQLKYVENMIAGLQQTITNIENSGTVGKQDEKIFTQLKSLELYLRRLKQKHGMGVKREEVVDDERRLEEAFGL